MSRLWILTVLLACEPLDDGADQQSVTDAQAVDDARLPDVGPPDDAALDASDGATSDVDPPADPPATARINFLRAPEDAELARASGCEGGNAGAGFGRFAAALGGLEPLVLPGADGFPLILVAELDPRGIMTLAEAWLDAENQYWFDVPRREWGRFALSAAEPGDPVTLGVRLPLLGVDLPVELSHAALTGRWAPGPRGLAIDSMRVMGLMEPAALTSLTQALVAACAAEPAPERCARWAPLQSDDPATRVAFVTGLVGGRDADVGAAGLVGCGPGAECAGVSVCLLMAGVPLEVAGEAERFP